MAVPPSIRKISDVVWELPAAYKEGMRVPARLFATRDLLEGFDQGVFEQIANVACLPGIEGYACCMADGHWGYGFPIGGVAAMRLDDGVVSPGGIGFDINCGMRLILTQLTLEDVKKHVQNLVDALFHRVPAGVGCRGFLRLDRDEFRRILQQGARWCVEHGYGWPEDLERTESAGCAAEADPAAVSNKAIERGLSQVGTLGSGNHYLEIQVIREGGIFDEKAAAELGLFPNQIVIMFHCGSRGFGHQVASDYVEHFLAVMGPKYHLTVPDRELACAPINSAEGQAYLTAMRCAINMSFANRQMILHRLREVFSRVLGKTPEELGMRQIYDIAHNTAKIEEIEFNGSRKKLLIHRKGSTRAYGPGFAELPAIYRELGQPVIIGGSMETGSYLLLGAESAKAAFYTTAHGAGRTMSRSRAKHLYRGQTLFEEMKQRGIYVRSASWGGLAEEAGGAYKNVDEVVRSAELAGLSRRVARFHPIGNVKG
jgi:tRNA-splicing ligase RtcB